MSEDNVSLFIDKLSKFLEKDKTLVSPVCSTSGGNLPLGVLLIYPDMDIEKLSNKQLIYVHAMLHRFYSNNSNKVLSKDDIVKMHNKVKKKINHRNFDRLDEVD